MKTKIYATGLALLVFALYVSGASAQALETENSGMDNLKPVLQPTMSVRAMDGIPTGGLLLVPESTNDRVMAFDPVTGNLLDANFIPSDPTNLSTPKEVILSSSGQSLLVADQLNDAVQEYDLDGNYVGLFAPAGGVDLSIMDNIRGIALRPNGNLLVTVFAGPNAGNVIEFNSGGVYQGVFFDGASLGFTSPFDVYLRPSLDFLVTEAGLNKLSSINLDGTFNADLALIDNFPEQAFRINSGNILVGNFGGTQQGVLEFTSAGALVGVYKPVTLNSFRGVYELPNGNILATCLNGVYEIDRFNNVIDTKYSGTGCQYITYIPPTQQSEIPLSPYMILLAGVLIILFTIWRARRVY